MSERATRIKLASSAWEAEVLPLNYTRKNRTCPYRTAALRVFGCEAGLSAGHLERQPPLWPRAKTQYAFLRGIHLLQ